jgi:AP-2 complex subunit alpha
VSQTCAAVGGSEMASLLTADVAQLLTNASMRPIVRKKAALALLRLLRKSSDNAEDILPAEVRDLERQLS